METLGWDWEAVFSSPGGRGIQGRPMNEQDAVPHCLQWLCGLFEGLRPMENNKRRSLAGES